MKQTNTPKSLLIAFILLILFSTSAIGGIPSSPTILYSNNETVSPPPLAYLNTSGGTFTTLLLNATNQDYKWKAYVGNVTGKLALKDQTNYSIYEWGLSTITGNVFVTRNNSIDWSNLTCANNAVISAEDTYLNINSTTVDSINKTFNNTVHKRFYASNNLISNSTCRSISTYVGGAVQSSGEANKFQEVLLKDTANKLIYASLLEDSIIGFDNNIYDFQMIIAEDETSATPTTYYFYLELV